MMLNSPNIDQVDLSRWKVIIGGATMSKALCAAAMQRGIDIYAGYGMSETCPILTLAFLKPDMLDASAEEQVEIRCKTGLRLPLVDLKVVDAEMNDLPHDGKSSGEIVVRAPWLTQGYLKDRKNSETLWAGGYLHTGDVANIDGRGYLKISDRIKDVIKIGGEWISSLELEDIIGHHPSVSEVAVIGQPDERWGERPLALVVPEPDLVNLPTEKQIVSHIQEYTQTGIISKQGLLTRVRFVEVIDKTSVGKVDKKTLRSKYL
jgi:fatty-acyl-CoA synthase